MYKCTYNNNKDYEWDSDKNRRNIIKHGIDFADAVAVFSDDSALTIPDESRGELRFVTIGIDALLRVLVVVYTMRGNRIRLISARKAHAEEKSQYEEK